MLSISNKISLSDTTKDSYSMEFNGSTQYIEVDSLAGDINEVKGTISFWVNMNTVGSSGMIFRSQEGTGSGTDNILQVLYHASSNELRMTYKGGGVTRSAEITSGDTVIEGQGWKHIVGTYDTGENEVKVYLDGVLQDTNTTTMTVHSASLDNAEIARNLGTSGAYYSGKIDELAIFTEVVSATTLYNGGNPVDYTGISGLIGYYKFEEGSGTSAFDSSGQGNTGTLNNSPTYSTDTP